MKVLVVDDSRMIRRVVRSVAEMLDLEFLEAGDGREALEVLAKESADISLVVLDWNMPRLDGLRCLQRMKANPRYHDIPVIMFTTESQEERREMAMRCGAAAYVSKPFTRETLVTSMMDVLGIE
ncbi:MAG: response regulator [Myxococcota bacterium]